MQIQLSMKSYISNDKYTEGETTFKETRQINRWIIILLRVTNY